MRRAAGDTGLNRVAPRSQSQAQTSAPCCFSLSELGPSFVPGRAHINTANTRKEQR